MIRTPLDDKRALPLVFFALAALLSVHLNAVAQQAASKKDVVIFAVAGEMGTTIDPIIFIRDGKFVFPEEADGTDEGLTKFAGEYYREGRKYRVISGGGEAGSLTVKRSHITDECFRTGADVELQTTVKVGRVLMALATDSESIGRGKPMRRAPTEEERTAALKLASDVMRQKRVPAAALKTLESINLTATDIDGDGRAELIGSFRAKQGKTARHLLFLIAEPQGDSFKMGHSEYERIAAKDLMDPSMVDEVGNAGFLAEILVDQADLDGDGVGEVVSTASSFEGQGYYIYKRAQGRWRKAYEGANYRCAY